MPPIGVRGLACLLVTCIMIGVSVGVVTMAIIGSRETLIRLLYVRLLFPDLVRRRLEYDLEHI